jgi:hypothetical protein
MDAKGLQSDIGGGPLGHQKRDLDMHLSSAQWGSVFKFQLEI